ncbi:MAG TPA: ABC transporter permease [Usitatibacteraceae bacterium]|nr:ABC transporter permease [Usitatibacteraceae bacterium]
MSTWLRLHRLALADAARRMAAQPVASTLAVAVMALAVALPLLASILVGSVSRATSGFDTEPHVNVFLALDATDEDVRRIEAALKANPETASVRFVPRAKALEELKATSHLAELLANLDRNPLPHAFSVRTRTSDAARLGTARTEWAKLAKVDQVSAEFEWAERISRWTRFAERALAGFAVVLAAAVLFIVGHLIRLQVLTMRDEIEVSQLIGATAADVRRPFIYHGLLQGMLAGLAAVALAALVVAWLNAELQVLTSTYAYEFKIVFMDALGTVQVIVAVAALGVIGAWLSVSRELRRFSAGV